MLKYIMIKHLKERVCEILKYWRISFDDFENKTKQKEVGLAHHN